MKHILHAILLTCSFQIACLGQGKSDSGKESSKVAAIAGIDRAHALYKQTALSIWSYAEVGYKEHQSSELLQDILRKNGFVVQRGVAEIPTAFVATFGTGDPVIGILAEFDALPGLSQEAIPERKPIAGKDAGHGCGHHLFGTASVAAGIEIKKLIDEKKIKGTVKVFGTPAEEGGSGKVYMVRAGLFTDVDAVIHWHPGDKNEVTMRSALANKSAKFRFYGTSAHASASPEKGRSALDAVESMNYMVNMMREHVAHETRIHYVITDGGKAPNVIPDFAEVYYYVRHPKRDQTVATFERVVAAAKGAALGTETRMDYEIIGGTHDLLINTTLAAVMHRNLEKIGGVKYDNDDVEFARQMQSTLPGSPSDIQNAGRINPLQAEVTFGTASTDVGDVSYVVPTVGLYSATWVPGTPALVGRRWLAAVWPLGRRAWRLLQRLWH